MEQITIVIAKGLLILIMVALTFLNVTVLLKLELKNKQNFCDIYLNIFR